MTSIGLYQHMNFVYADGRPRDCTDPQVWRDAADDPDDPDGIPTVPGHWCPASCAQAGHCPDGCSCVLDAMSAGAHISDFFDDDFQYRGADVAGIGVEDGGQLRLSEPKDARDLRGGLPQCAGVIYVEDPNELIIYYDCITNRHCILPGNPAGVLADLADAADGSYLDWAVDWTYNHPTNAYQANGLPYGPLRVIAAVHRDGSFSLHPQHAGPAGRRYLGLDMAAQTAVI